MSVRILSGDSREVLQTLPDCSVQCCVTSPPYFGLRDYGCEGQIGLEASPDAYVAEMVAVFRELRRVLADSGTVWLNLGDSYCSTAPGTRNAPQPKGSRTAAEQWANFRPPTPDGLKPKDLLMIPARVALALQADGWWLRSDIIWAKPNPMPESVTDRPTSAHEHVFLLAKSARYFWDADAVAEPGSDNSHGGAPIEGGPKQAAIGQQVGGRMGIPANGTRNLRNVWTIATQPYSGAHFAVMPAALAEICIKAGSSERGQCPSCRAPWARVVERIDQGYDGSRYGERVVAAAAGAKTGGTARSTLGSSNGKLTGKTNTTGWSPTCACPAHTPVPQTVLDPFGGAGTTGLVADRLGRNAILIELNPAYADLARDRLRGDCPMFAEVA